MAQGTRKISEEQGGPKSSSAVPAAAVPSSSGAVPTEEKEKISNRSISIMGSVSGSKRKADELHGMMESAKDGSSKDGKGTGGSSREGAKGKETSANASASTSAGVNVNVNVNGSGGSHSHRELIAAPDGGSPGERIGGATIDDRARVN
jgi:hypothetical protein